jgi:hypothetical protein
MSLVSLYAALEDFTEEVNSSVGYEPPADGAFNEPTAGVDFPEESGNIDADVDQIAQAAQGLENIIAMVEEAPGAMNEPLSPFAAKAANIALESNEMVEVSGNNPLATTGDKGHTKQDALDKIKAFAQRVWDMLRNFGKKIAAWIRDIWAKYTDRIVKNAAMAKKIFERADKMADKQGAKVTDKALLAKIATYKNVSVSEVVLAVSEHAEAQGSKDAEALTKEARTCIDVVASGSSSAEGVMDRFVEALAKAAGTYKDKASAEQAQAVKAAAGTETYLSDPFFAGYRAWTTVPENADALSHWNHGINKVDEVKPQESVEAPNGEEIKAIATHIVGMGSLVQVYKNNLKTLDDLNRSLDAAASKAKNAKSESAQLKAMQAVVPRIIKGPQVAAYAYAVSASTTALQFCLAAIAAHTATEQEKAE